MVPISYCCNYATVIHISMQIFSFLVLFVIAAYRSVLKPRISKTHLPIHLICVNLN